MHSNRFGLFYILFAVIFSGCTSYTSLSQITAMPEPLIYSEANIRKIIYTDPIPQNNPIFYVTDRTPSESKDDAFFYTNSRASVLRVGSGQPTVSPLNNKNKISISTINEYGYISTALPYGQLSSPSDENLANIAIADKSFSEQINKKLSTSSQKDIFIYVHGYKTVFENPLLVSSEFWQYMNNDGVFIAYSWPATPKSLAYFKDVETARLSGQNLRLFLEYLANNTDAERIHVIGYSAGTRVVITATQQLALKYGSEKESVIREKTRIGNIILAASDYDPRIFAAAIGNGLINIPEMLTIYMSASDDALSISRLLFDQNRLGQFIDKPLAMPKSTRAFFQNNDKLFFVNASNAQRARIGNGHNYYFGSPWVSSDVLLILKQKLKPESRGLIRPEGKIHWNFSENHPESLLEALSN